MVDTTIEFIMGLLVVDDTLRTLTDRKLIAELPRLDTKLDGGHKTVVGMTIENSSQESYFRSQIRGYIKSDITAHVMVLTGYGSTDQHCREVVDRIEEILQDAAYVGTYRIFINSLKSDIKVDKSQWTGNIMVGITRFDPIS